MSCVVRSILVLLSSFCLGGILSAQPTWDTSVHYGTVLKINPVFPAITQPAWSVDVGVQLPRYKLFPQFTQRSWPLQLSGARWYLHLQYHQLGNPEVLGQGITLLPSLDMPLWRTKTGGLFWRQGVFVGWVSKTYDRETNPTNNLIGSHFNVYAQTRIGWQQNVKEQWSWGLGLSYSHFSNGRTRVPNLGINVPALYFQVRTRPAQLNRNPPPISASMGKKHFQTGVRVGWGRTTFKAPDGPQHSTYSIALYEQLHRVQKLFIWQIGTEWFFDQSSYAFALNQELPRPRHNAIGGAVFVGAELRLNPISFVLQVGPYLKVPFPNDYRVKTRFGVQFYGWPKDEKRAFIGAYVHAHGGEADFLDLGIGYLF